MSDIRQQHHLNWMNRRKTVRTDILLVVATDVELDAVISAAAELTNVVDPPLIHQDDRTYHDLGVIGGAQALAVQCEMGTSTLGGSLSTVIMAISEVQPTTVIMVGIAFGVDPEEQSIGQVLVSKQVKQYDVQRIGTVKGGNVKILSRGDKATATTRVLSRFRAAARYHRDLPLSFGLVLSGEKLVDNLDYRDALLKCEPEADGGEMEGGGLYVGATEKGVDWCIVKAICDYADGRKRENKKQRQKIAAKNAAVFVLSAIRQGGFARRESGSAESETAKAGNDESVSINGGPGGTGGDGGDVNIIAGSGFGDSKGGDVNITAGSGFGGSKGGDVNIIGGSGGHEDIGESPTDPS